VFADETGLVFELGQIALAVRLVKHAPLFVGQINRVLQALKHPVTRFGPLTQEAQCRQGQCVSGVVGQIETAFDAEFFVPGAFQPAKAGTQQALAFRFRRRLDLQLADAHQVIELRVAHGLCL
jgi:hypothetical protein